MGQKTTASWKVDGPSHEEISAFAETVQAGYSKSIPHLGRRKVPEMWVCLSENDRKKTTQNRWFIIFYPYSTHSHDERGRFSSIFRHTGPFLGDKNAQEMLGRAPESDTRQLEAFSSPVWLPEDASFQWLLSKNGGFFSPRFWQM